MITKSESIVQAGLVDHDYVVRVNHCLNKDNCYNEQSHVCCMSYRCEDYKPKHTKNAKIQAKYLLRRQNAKVITANQSRS